MVEAAQEAIHTSGGTRRPDVTRAWLHRVMTSSPQATWLTVRYGRHQVVSRGRVAAEHRPGYDAAGAEVRPDRSAPATPRPAGAGSEDAVGTAAPRHPATDDADVAGADAAVDTGAARTADRMPSGTAADGSADRPPFGLPVLAELPELASALAAFTTADDRMLDGILTLSRLLDSGEVEATTGVSVEQWIGIVARHTRMDRRLLLRLCRLLHRLPTLKAAVEGRQVSYAQLRGLGLALRRAPASIDAELDDFLARLLPEVAGADPDVVVDQVTRAIDELSPDTLDAHERGLNRHLHLQPNLERTGGRFSGETDAIGLALLDEATAPTRRQLDHPGGLGGARHDNLLGRLAHTCDDQPTTADGSDAAAGADTGPTSGDADDAGDAAPSSGDSGPASSAATAGAGPERAARPRSSLDIALPPVKLLARVELDRLLDGDRTPADLVTRLVGGQLRLSSDAARRLLDARGVELRTIVVDHGTVVGVGRQTRMPPGWLRDATVAVHDTCTAPLCDRPARSCDLDHAVPWHPHRPDDPSGRTDIDQLGPLCGRTNQQKEAGGWQVTQTGDGRRTWTHPRTGLTITTVPATWRPPGTDPPRRRGTGPPDGDREPGPNVSKLQRNLGRPPRRTAEPDPPDPDPPF
jgi:hypothetical protein